MSQSPLQQECGLVDAHSRSKEFWGMCCSSSGNCFWSLWHRKLNLDLKRLSRSSAVGETALFLSLLQPIPPSHASPFLGQCRAFLSVPLCLVCLHCQPLHIQLNIAADGLHRSRMALPAIALQKTKSTLFCSPGGWFTSFPCSCWFLLFPTHKVCQHELRPQHFRFLLACITSLSSC